MSAAPVYHHPLDAAHELYLAGGYAGPRPPGWSMKVKAHLQNEATPNDPSTSCVLFQHRSDPIVAELWLNGVVWYGLH